MSLPLAIYIYRTLPLRLLHDLECFSRVTKRHRGQEMLVCVIRSLKWRFCPQLSLIFDFLSPIALFHPYPKTLNPHYIKMRARSTTHTHKLFQKKARQIDQGDSYVSYSAIISVNSAFTDASSIGIDLRRKSIVLEGKTGFKSI